MDFLIGVLVGILFLAICFYFLRNSFTRNKTEEQSVILLEKIRNVSKLITVEGDFAEIMHFEDVKSVFLNYINSKKKAIVFANAKVLIGFDMEKVKIVANAANKRIYLEHLPEPEVISIETDIQYYDVSHGLFNKFAANDLSELNKKVKVNIESKIPESKLLASAKLKALDTVNLIDQLVSTFGWHLEVGKSVTAKIDPARID